jgi:NAD(P)-dependent dehydrogenase (short-subunit alcohol dehydrogenase family)
MAKNGGGSIINTASIAALKPGGGVMPYRAAKSGVVGFTRCAAMDLAPHGIRVNCIAPGLIQTGITNYDMAPVRKMMQPLPRAGETRDVANAALYLASERSAQVTGLILPVDGGSSVGSPMALPR